MRVRRGEFSGDSFRSMASHGAIAGWLEAKGLPVRGALIKVTLVTGENVDPWTCTMTDKNGQFSYPGLAPGAYHVLAVLGGRTSELERVEIREGEVAEVELTLDV